jgi:cobalamin biosynthesis Mg chelatase CobN
MRRCVSALAVLAGLAFSAPALADSPVEVYNDFASDGTLSCGHSRAALTGALKDASLQQYGDPLTSVQMKLAIRKQLAGGCRVVISARPTGGTLSGSGESSAGAVPSEQTKRRGEARKRAEGSSSKQSTREAAAPSASASTDGKRSGGMIFLGICLLLLVLGSGGWAARRAFGDRT